MCQSRKCSHWQSFASVHGLPSAEYTDLEGLCDFMSNPYEEGPLEDGGQACDDGYGYSDV